MEVAALAQLSQDVLLTLVMPCCRLEPPGGSASPGTRAPPGPNQAGVLCVRPGCKCSQTMETLLAARYGLTVGQPHQVSRNLHGVLGTNRARRSKQVWQSDSQYLCHRGTASSAFMHARPVALATMPTAVKDAATGARQVLVLRLVTEGTVETAILQAAKQKRQMADQIITGGFFDGQTSAEARRR